jgi:hypothetical protein
MKKITLFIVAMLAATLTYAQFGQLKYKPKVIVVVLGKHNPTFNESRFPNLHFYYTPNMVLKTSAKASKNQNKRAWSTAIGFGRTAGAEAHDSYTGEPAILVQKRARSGLAYLLDKNGDIAAKTFNGEKEYFNAQTSMLVDFKRLQRKIVSESFGDLTKSLIKKGETVKKKKKNYQDIGEKFYDFNVVDVNGNEHSMSSLIEGNPATLVFYIYINSEYDLNKGKESGAGKKGRDYMNQVAQTVAAERQIAPLYNLEKGIFGNRITD